MKVVLPSSGALGLKSVEMRAPTFNDLRNLNNSNQIEGILKIEFVKSLISPNTDLSKMTKFDMEYLFLIAAASIQYNTLTYTITCSCGEVNKGIYRLEEKEVQTLEGKWKPYKMSLAGRDLSYHLLSAKGEEMALEYAIQHEDFDTAYQDAVVSLTFENDLSIVNTVKDLDATVYLSAFLFQGTHFHGLHLKDKIQCKCGEELNVHLVGTTDLVRIDIGSLMRQFAAISDHISFEGFLTFTVPEFRTYIKALNDKLNGN